MNPKLKLRMRNSGMGLLAFAVAFAIWLPCLHFFFRKPLSDFYQESGISPKARQLAARHLRLWTDPKPRQAELKRMRSSNAEWDFMGRSFLVWSLANMGLREPQMKDQLGAPEGPCEGAGHAPCSQLRRNVPGTLPRVR